MSQSKPNKYISHSGLWKTALFCSIGRGVFLCTENGCFAKRRYTDLHDGAYN